MRRILLALAAVALLALPAWGYTLSASRITTTTTTHVVAASTGKTVAVMSGSVCIDGDGVATNITVQDTAATNLIGTNVVYHLNPGSCVTWQRSAREHGPHFIAGSGLGVDIVTSANGPANAAFEVIQQ